MFSLIHGNHSANDSALINTEIPTKHLEGTRISMQKIIVSIEIKEFKILEYNCHNAKL